MIYKWKIKLVWIRKKKILFNSNTKIIFFSFSSVVWSFFAVSVWWGLSASNVASDTIVVTPNLHSGDSFLDSCGSPIVWLHSSSIRSQWTLSWSSSTTQISPSWSRWIKVGGLFAVSMWWGLSASNVASHAVGVAPFIHSRNGFLDSGGSPVVTFHSSSVWGLWTTLSSSSG